MLNSEKCWGSGSLPQNKIGKRPLKNRMYLAFIAELFGEGKTDPSACFYHFIRFFTISTLQRHQLFSISVAWEKHFALLFYDTNHKLLARHGKSGGGGSVEIKGRVLRKIS